MVASRGPPTGDLARNPGMCPDWELDRDPFFRRLVLNLLSRTSQGPTGILHTHVSTNKTPLTGSEGHSVVYDFLRLISTDLASPGQVVQLLDSPPAHDKVVASIPSPQVPYLDCGFDPWLWGRWSTYRRQLMDVSLYPSLSKNQFLKIPQVRI